MLHLSDSDRRKLESDLAAAEPYDEDDPILLVVDGEVDFARMRATMARKFLRMADENKRDGDIL